jgi:hypothetical protein
MNDPDVGGERAGTAHFSHPTDRNVSRDSMTDRMIGRSIDYAESIDTTTPLSISFNLQSSIEWACLLEAGDSSGTSSSKGDRT